MTDSIVKILMVDIETSPIKALTWETFNTNVLKVLEPSKVICTSWKWLHEEEIHVKAICDYKGYKPGKIDDKALCEEVWKLLDEADIVCGHNARAFDIKRLNARFVVNGLSAPSDYEIIDTLKVAKRHFKFDSNSLNNLGLFLDEGQKISNGGLDLWIKCMNGDKESWDLMKKYNCGDVALLERVYYRLRPFMDNHPNVNLIAGKPLSDHVCNVCSSKKTHKRGFIRMKTGKKQRYQCNDCGSWSVGKFQRVGSSYSEESEDEGLNDEQ